MRFAKFQIVLSCLTLSTLTLPTHHEPKLYHKKKSKSVPSDNECNDEPNDGEINRTPNVESEVRIEFGQRELNISRQSLSFQDLETPSKINFDPNSIISDCDMISDHDIIVSTDSSIVNEPSHSEIFYKLWKTLRKLEKMRNHTQEQKTF
ncbi:Uncharacterized protein DBV15_05023 [Temnothorax longispinosus]|uniref:Uncharacterized protein n=1 Tax=Temnothorax longispinosus TaxID=300112 RepID=A0A4S2KNH7_9HYME|nr:Uncharacterized protein DBV15_05023 [Temnothorax longispinosus]